MSVITNRPRDCLACRLIGGFGLTGVGAYIGYHGYRKTGYGRLGMLTVAAGTMVLGKNSRLYAMVKSFKMAASLGMARIFNLPPFGITFSQNSQGKLEGSEQKQ